MDSALGRHDLNALIVDARQSGADALERLLALYRPYLRLAAGRRLPRLIRQRTDASDIVQQTMIDATRGISEFRGGSEPEFTAWISKLLERNLLQSIRQHTVGKRDVRLERDGGDASGSAQVQWRSLACDGSSPVSSVIRGEAALQLAAALDQLPGDQRTAVELRYVGQETLQAIADEMQRTVGSVAGLIRRGVEALHGLLPVELGES